MSWFKKKQPTPDIVVQPNAASRVEVEVDKNARKEVKEAAKEVNTHVKNLLVENGFTLKIVLAAHNPSARNKGSGA